MERFKPNDAIRVVRIGDLSLIRNEWPIIGEGQLWKRSDWPMPPFIRRDDLSGKAWRVHYSDEYPNAIEYEKPQQYESKLEREAVLGAGPAELVLTKLLADTRQ